jgi:hypothetical protein
MSYVTKKNGAQKSLTSRPVEKVRTTKTLFLQRQSGEEESKACKQKHSRHQTENKVQGQAWV